MIVALSLACGVMAAGGTYFMWRARLFDFLIGLTLIGHAVNLSIFVASNAQAGPAPLINVSESVLAKSALDPVPQALILTAIVISFGTTTLLAVLLRTSLKSTGLARVESSDDDGRPGTV